MPVDPPDDATLRRIEPALRARTLRRRPRLVPPVRRGLLGVVERRRGALRRVAARDARAVLEPPGRPPTTRTTRGTSRRRSPESGDGPLAGKTVAIKDNTAVAGVPMMNGSGTMEGYTPPRDATVVSRRPRGGRHDHRQGGLRGPLLLRRLAHLPDRPRAQPVGRDPLGGRVVLGQRGARDLGHRRRRDRWRPGRFGAHPERLQRHGRAQADVGPRALHRRVPHRADHRPRRPDHAHGRRRRVDAERARRTGRARPAAAAATSCRTTTWPRSPRTPPGCGSASSREGFGHPELRGRPSTTRCARPPRRCAVRASSSRTSRSRGTCTARRSGTSSPPRARPPRWSTPTATA